MFRNDRGIVIVLVAWLAFAAFISWDQHKKAEIYCANGGITGGCRPQQHAKNRAGIPGYIQRAINNPEPLTGEDHEKRDLAAQEASAAFAFWMVVFAGFSVLVTTIGTILLYKQIILTRKAVADTSKATDAVRESNEIARLSHIEQRATQRPLMQFDVDSFEMYAYPRESPYNHGNTAPYEVPVTGIRLSFDFRNYGQQPCWIESTWLGFFVSSGQHHEISADKMLQFRGATAGFILPDRTVPGAGAIYTLPQSDLDLLNTGPKGIVIFGACQYRSPSGNLFSTRFAYHANVGNGRHALSPARIREHWRDGRIAAVKMELHDAIEYLD